MSTHTPGPWINKSGHIFQATPYRPPIEDGADPMNDMRRHHMIATTSHEVKLSENQANANLIAAAPELLEALKGVEDWAEEMENDEPISGSDLVDWFGQFYQTARAAIAKAEGRA